MVIFEQVLKTKWEFVRQKFSQKNFLESGTTFYMPGTRMGGGAGGR